MKIDGFGSITSTANSSGASKKRGVSSGNFAELLAAAEGSDTDQAAALGDIAPPALTNLLALQEVPEEFLQRKKLVQQGNHMLDTLEKLRRQLLMGSLTLSTLRDIEQQIAIHKQTVNDPQLTEIIDDIELRAAVEAAKLRYAMPQPE